MPWIILVHVEAADVRRNRRRPILAEAEACHKAHPNNHVRLVGFDNYAQSQGASMVIYRGPIKV